MFCNWVSNIRIRRVIHSEYSHFRYLDFNNIGESGEGKLSQKLNRLLLLVVCHEMNYKIDWSRKFTICFDHNGATLFD